MTGAAVSSRSDGLGSLPPVLFLHGIFSHPGLLSHWADRFEDAGYECHAPSLPGRDPTDHELLRSAGVSECFAAVREARERLDRPPIVIGHSFGGLLAQKLAAGAETAALVLLASVPPGILWAQPRSVRYLMPLLPRILAGEPIFPNPDTFRAVPFSALPRAEQDDLLAKMVPDSGRAFRAMTLGAPSTRVAPGSIRCPVLCVSGTSDRNVSTRAARRIAKRYGAEHQVHAGAPHWIVADSLLDQVSGPVIEWLGSVIPTDETAATPRASRR